jgi:hypothetical protein
MGWETGISFLPRCGDFQQKIKGNLMMQEIRSCSSICLEPEEKFIPDAFYLLDRFILYIYYK